MTDSKSVVREFLEAAEQEGPGALSRFGTKDAVWTLPGLGVLTPERFAKLGQRIGDLLAGPMTLTIHDIIADGEKVAAEVESHGLLKDGKVYNNLYHFKFVLRDGKIAEVKEYNDTKHALETWGDPFAD